MTDKKQQKSSQHLKNGYDAQQQKQHLNGTVENPITNNSRHCEYDRDSDRKVFVGGLSKETTERDLREHFDRFGNIQYIDVKLMAATGQCRGFAFIVFRTMEGVDNALAYNDHVINDKKINVEKALPRHTKLFIGGLTPNLTDNDIKDYFKHYATLLRAHMPYDQVTNKRKGFCFLTFDSMQAVTEILRVPKHVIKGIKVDVEIPVLKANNYGMIPDASEPMRGMHGDVRDREDSLHKYGYVSCNSSYCHEVYGYYIPHTGYSPDYSYSYGYPRYIPSVVANYQYGNYEESAPSSVYGNQIVE